MHPPNWDKSHYKCRNNQRYGRQISHEYWMKEIKLSLVTYISKKVIN